MGYDDEAGPGKRGFLTLFIIIIIFISNRASCRSRGPEQTHRSDVWWLSGPG
jgi:hypothetical protein